MTYNVFDPYANNETVETWQPPWGADLPAPPIYNYDSGGRSRGYDSGWRTYNYDWKKRNDDNNDDTIDNQVGYETDWKYPNWLIRMAQWRNF